MIKNVLQHQDHILRVRKKIYEHDVLFDDYRDNQLVSLKCEADAFFVNLNKYHLLDEVNFDRKNTFCKDVLFHQLLNEIDLGFHHSYLTNEVITIVGDVNKLSSPSIFCSFHYGPYTHVPTALQILNKSITVISKMTKGDVLIGWDKEEEKNVVSQDFFFNSKTIDPTSVDATFQIYNALKEGRNVLLYIDTFLDKIDDSSKRKKKFELFNYQMFLTSGIPEISKKLNVPIVPVIAERNKQGNKINVFFYDSVCKGDTSLKDYENLVFQECFDVFGKHLIKKPEQWDQWQFIHKNFIRSTRTITKKDLLVKFFREFFKRSSISQNSIVKFDEACFQIFERENETYLININNYNCFKISTQLAQILKRINDEDFLLKQVQEVLNTSLLEDLINKKVLKRKNTKNES